MELTQHTVWSIFQGAETFESFQNNYIYPIVLKKEVPEVIKESAIVSEKLLLHSYYEYNFIDVALTHTIFAFEKALRLRWSEIHNKTSKKISLQELIDWFYANNYFETQNVGLPHQLRHIRNGKVHDETNSLGGVTFIQKVYETFDLVNDLYENPALRIIRTKARHSLNEELSAFTTSGTILSYNDKRLIVFCAHPFFINNKSIPNTLSLFVSPIFDLSPYKLNRIYTPPYFTITVSEWELNNNIFTGIDVLTGNLIELTQIQDEENLNTFQLWTQHFYSIDNFALNLFNATEPMNELFIKKLRNFHGL